MKISQPRRTYGWLLSLGLAILTAFAVGAAGDTNQVIPQFTPSGGLFKDRVAVKLDSPVSDAEIRFTVDGTEPVLSSAVYSKPLGFSRPTYVRARVFRGGKPLGPEANQTYASMSTELAAFTGNLPIVVIQMFGQSVQHESKKVGSIQIFDVKAGRSSMLDPTGDSQKFRGDVWWRGNSSLRYLKRSIGFKIRDENGKAHSLGVLGFPADSDWVLYAPYPDKSLIRDVLAYDLSREMGHYASRTKFVEVYLNEGNGRLSQSHYLGVYVLEEKIKRSPSRVNVQKLGTNDNTLPLLTGGYIFKKDHTSNYGEVEPTEDGRPNFGGGNAGSRYGYPTGPGGFPADPRGFLPPLGGDRMNNRGRGNRLGEPMFDDPLPGRQLQNRSLQDRSLQERRPLERQRRGELPLGVPAVPANPPPPGPRGGGAGAEILAQNAQPQPKVFDFFPGRDMRGPTTIRRIGPGGRVMDAVEEVFFTGSGNEFFYVEPKPEDITSQQKTWLRNYLNEFERALYSPDFADSKKGYAAYIDVDSFIDYHITVEVTKNIDGFRFSTYFEKDRDGRLKAEPIWDWNLSFGNANGKQGYLTNYWYWPQLDDQQYSYYRRLFEDPEFAQRYVDRWGELRATVLSTTNLMARIDAHVASIGEARIRNFARWPIIGRPVWPNYYNWSTYEDEIRYLKRWTMLRLSWISDQFTPAPEISANKSGGTRSVSLSAGKGEIFYTLDGSDPRAAGGGVSAKAQRYAGPVSEGRGTKLMARTVFEKRWSPPVHVP